MPFAPGLDPAELRTRLRAMRALTHVLTGPRDAELSGLLLSAENDNDALANGEMSIRRLVMTGNRLSLTFANPEMDQEFALEDLEEGLLWGVLLFSVRWHHVKARASVQR